MPQFKLLSLKFIDGEQRWTYSIKFNFIFNQNQIQQVTITDHYQKKHKKVVNNELIIGILTEMINGDRMRPRQRYNARDVYVPEWIPYGKRDYRLVFWFKDGSNDHLWIRNCYPQD